MGKAAEITYEKLASIIATKRDEAYNTVMGWICCQIAFLCCAQPYYASEATDLYSILMRYVQHQLSWPLLREASHLTFNSSICLVETINISTFIFIVLHCPVFALV